MRKRKYKRKRLIAGDKILMLAAPQKRAPVRVDRNMPIDYETYLAEKHERERLAARDRLLATAVASDAPSTHAVVSGDAVNGGDDESAADNGAFDDRVAECESFDLDGEEGRGQ